MKKVFVMCAILATSVMSGFAQIKVDSIGRIAINTNASPKSPISLSCGGNAAFFTYYHDKQRALYSQSDSVMTNSSIVLIPDSLLTGSYPLRVISRPFNPIHSQHMALGVYSSVESGPYTYGVVGTINPSSGGAGIVGSSNQNIPSQATIGNHAYAGYFMGDVKTKGSLTVTNGIYGTVYGRATSSQGGTGATASVQSIYRGESSTLSLLSGLTAKTYRDETPSGTERDASSTIVYDSLDITTETPADGFVEQQGKTKTHFALDAEQLEAVFPDLVYELEDGTKAVNYMEMIPLLVQTIRELNAKVTALEGNDAAQSRSGATSVESRFSVKASLAQNTPNPFSEQTTIRFTLPDNVRDAAIYVFDMSGKMLRKLPVTQGMTSVSIGAYELGKGMFLYTLMVNGQEIDTKRMIITK